jgi:hypothetical protein
VYPRIGGRRDRASSGRAFGCCSLSIHLRWVMILACLQTRIGRPRRSWEKVTPRLVCFSETAVFTTCFRAWSVEPWAGKISATDASTPSSTCAGSWQFSILSLNASHHCGHFQFCDPGLLSQASFDTRLFAYGRQPVFGAPARAVRLHCNARPALRQHENSSKCWLPGLLIPRKKDASGFHRFRHSAASIVDEQAADSAGLSWHSGKRTSSQIFPTNPRL